MTAFAQDLFYVDEPVACYNKHEFPCAVRILQRSSLLEVSKVKIFAAPGSSVVFLNNGNLRLLEGNFFIDSEQEIKVEAGVVTTLVHGESLLQKEENGKVTIANFTGENKVTGVFQKLSEPILPGLSKWYAGTNQKGELEQGVLSPLNPRVFLPTWRNLTVYPKAVAQEKLSHYKVTWKKSVELSAEFYKEIVELRLAAEDQKRVQREKRIQFEKDERMKLRQLFRERNNLN